MNNALIRRVARILTRARGAEVYLSYTHFGPLLLLLSLASVISESSNTWNVHFLSGEGLQSLEMIIEVYQL